LTSQHANKKRCPYRKTESKDILECPHDQPEEEQHLCTIISKATHAFQDIIDMLRLSEKSASARQSNSSTTRNTRGRGRRARASMRTNIQGKSNTAGDRQENERLRNPINYNELFLFPGDVCIIIRPPMGMNSSYICLFVASLLWRENGRVAERCIWIKKEKLKSFYT